jgi:hypothetical protein
VKPEEIAKSFEFLLDAMLSWAKCVRHPLLTWKQILTDAQGEESKAIKAATKLWLTSYIMSMLLLGWVYKLHGINMTDVGFYLSSAFLVFAFLVLFVVSMHVGFTLFKLPAPFQDTFVAYTVIVSACMPFTSILAAPSLMQTLKTLKAIKTQDLELSGAVVAYFSMAVTQSSSTVGTLSVISQIFLIPLGLLLMSTIFDMLASRWEIDRVRVYSAGTFGTAVVVVLPMLLMSFFQMLVMYSFL